MALRQITFTLGQRKEDVRATSTGTVTAISGGASSLGGTIGMVVIIDDATLPTETDAHIGIELIEQVLTELPWPPA